jgi:hypothetical protein
MRATLVARLLALLQSPFFLESREQPRDARLAEAVTFCKPSGMDWDESEFKKTLALTLFGAVAIILVLILVSVASRLF